jgi:hypothetical protein
MSDRTARTALATAVVAAGVAAAFAGLAAAQTTDTSFTPLSIAPPKVSFGKVTTGDTEFRSVTLTNTGTEPLRLDGAWSTSERLDEGFVWPTGDICLRVEWESLAPGARCTITFAWAPERAGSAKATFVLMVDDPGTTLDIRLSGVGAAR